MKFGAIALAMATLSITGPGLAQQSQTVAVDYTDLDLTTEAGKNELDRRVDRAAREVCGMGDVTTGSRLNSRDARTCYADARTKLGNHVAAKIAPRSTRGG